jgi:hypothetical protein
LAAGGQVRGIVGLLFTDSSLACVGRKRLARICSDGAKLLSSSLGHI